MCPGGPEGGWKHDSLGCSKVIGGGVGVSLRGSEVPLWALDQENVCPWALSGTFLEEARPGIGKLVQGPDVAS